MFICRGGIRENVSINRFSYPNLEETLCEKEILIGNINFYYNKTSLIIVF